MLDLDPQGPLPPQIYWRRRALAVGVAAVVIGVVVAIVVVISSNSSDETAEADQPSAAEAAEPEPLPGEDPEVKTPVVPPAQEAPPPTAAPATPTTAVTPPPVLREGDDCPDSALAVKGITSQPEYVVGDQPKFTMVVTNIGLVGCQRDVGASVLAAYVYSLDNTRLWSNLDCAPSNETLVKPFQPGEQVTTEVTWTGMGSAPNCPLPREPIGPGTYNLVVQLGNLRSAKVPFTLAPAPAGQPSAHMPNGQAGAPGPAGN